MCNAMRPKEPFKEFPCKENGTAWKIFHKNCNGRLLSMIDSFSYKNKNGEIIWDEYFSYSYKKGFCLIALKKDAIKMLNKWSRNSHFEYVLRKVEYKQALIKRTEPDLTWCNPIVIIAEVFKPILEEGEYL